MVRFKNRYIVIEVDAVKVPQDRPFVLKSKILFKAIYNTLETLHGDFGVACTVSGLSVRYCNKETRIGVIRCRHGPHRLIASVLPFIKQIEEDNVQLRTLYTGATLCQCYKFIRGYQLQHLRRFYKMLPQSEKHLFRRYEKSVMDVETLYGKKLNKKDKSLLQESNSKE